MANRPYHYEPDSGQYSKQRFYDKIRHYLEDWESLPTPGTNDGQVALTDGFKDEDIYGVISKEEIEMILGAAEKQQLDSTTRSKPVKCDTVRGGSLAKLLQSKSGFHNPSSTEYLSSKLHIDTSGRHSLLGGLTSFNPDPENGLQSVLQVQKGMQMREEATRLYDLITKDEDTNKLNGMINSLFAMDENNGDALAVRGKWNLRLKNYETAIRDLRLAIENKCWNERAIRGDLCEAHHSFGNSLYYRGQYRDALDQSYLALNEDEKNEHAFLLKGMCERQLGQQQIGYSKSFLERRR